MDLSRLATRSLVELLCLVAATFSIVLPYQCAAQGEATAFKTAEISAFGGYLYWNPDYGPSRDNGAALGVNYTRYFHFPVAPSLEARVNAANGPYANEKSYLVGVRGVSSFRDRYHPYVDFLVGKGTIHYKGSPVLIGDNSAVSNYGGGVDIDVAKQFAVKVDVQAQRWRTGLTTFYYPAGVLLGVTYRIPFRPYVSQSDPH